MANQVTSYEQIENGSVVAAGNGWTLKLEDGSLNMYKGEKLEKSQHVTEDLKPVVVTQYNKRQSGMVSMGGLR